MSGSMSFRRARISRTLDAGKSGYGGGGGGVLGFGVGGVTVGTFVVGVGACFGGFFPLVIRTTAPITPSTRPTARIIGVGLLPPPRPPREPPRDAPRAPLREDDRDVWYAMKPPKPGG